MHQEIDLSLIHIQMCIRDRVKNHVAANNTTFKLADAKRPLEEGVEKVTEEDWKKCIEHVKKEEAKLWELDNLIAVSYTHLSKFY